QRGSHSGGFGGPGPRSRLEDTDGDVTMSDSPQDTSGQHRWRQQWSWRQEPDRVVQSNGAYYNSCHRTSIFLPYNPINVKIICFTVPQIPHGKKYDKKWLLSALQNICSVPYTPVILLFTNVFFFCHLMFISKVEVHVNDSAPPSFLLSDLKPEHLEHLKACLFSNLIIAFFFFVIDLVSHNIEIVLNWKTNMEAVIKIIEENIPELTCLNLSNNRIHKLDELAELVTKVPNLKTLNLSNNELKSDRELDKVKGLKLVELWLNRNPLCNHFKDQASYISAVRQRFPRLLKLDGHDLPPPIGFDVETPTTIPSCKGSCFGSDEIKALILRFLQQYYSIYDSGNRQPLLDAYHDGASLSLTTPYSTQNPSRSSLGEYHKDSRNLKRIKDSTMRFRLLKHTRLNVVAFLNELPKTQHDIASFTVDVNTYTNTLLSFTVSGVFKEVAVDGKSRDSTMAFSRVFITVPAGNSGLCIVNDQLFIRMATTEEIRRAFVAPAPTPSSSPVPTLTSQQQEMLTAFSQKSGMNLEWSQKCLQDNEWDFNRAAQIFTQLKVTQVCFCFFP
uniref:Nuclear RNA export factor 1 n=1 Tax=Anabas testudineus TaxID=64144 RepID=A0A7N5ZY31_ANATE